MVLALLARNTVLLKAVDRLGVPTGLPAARHAFTVSSLLLAIVIGSLPALAFPALDYETRLVLTVFFCCWCSAGMASVGTAPRLYSGYLLIMLGAMSIGWIRSGAPQAWYVVGLLLLYGLGLRAFSFGIARRITESIAIRTENEELVRQLSQANEAKTRFIMAASHDLRQPLHAISYLGGVLARARDPEDVRNANEALTTAVEGLNKLFSAILDLSRIESGAVRTNLVAFKVDALVAQLDSEYRGLCVAAGRRWECQVESATAQSDPALLERILRNLLDNALKHGGSGVVRLAVWRGDDDVVITVSDTGPGIPAHERSRVFDEFYRVNEGAGQPGLGLGLSIVRRLVDRLGCRLEVDYTDPATERGTTMTLHVPRGIEPTPAPGRLPALAPAGDEDVAGLSVLVIEDDATVLHATRALLAQWRCRVATCARASELDAVLQAFGAPDVAIVDYQLEPGVNGLDVVGRARARYPAMGVVMVTAESDSRVRDQLADSGLPVLEKPVSPRELRLTLALFKAAGE
jgi:signal transduction histidine kinase